MKESVRIKRELKRKEQNRKIARLLKRISIVGIILDFTIYMFAEKEMSNLIISVVIFLLLFGLLILSLVGLEIENE